MSTLVMVKKNGEACMAAETLMSIGSRKQSARYVASPEKILRVGDSYLGFVGWSVHRTVLESVFAGGFALPEFQSELELFDFSRTLHRKLKDEYFLNPRESEDDAYESSRMSLFVMNRHGLFELDAWRFAQRYERFAAAGSGSSYALGAMYAAWQSDASVEEIARVGVEAGIEFDDGSFGPITLKKLKLEA